MVSRSVLGKVAKLFGIFSSLSDAQSRQVVATALLEADEKIKYFKELKKPTHIEGVGGAHVDVAPFLITANNGLFCFENNKLSQLLACTCFGLDVHGDDIFLGISAGDESYVVRGKIGQKNTGSYLYGLRELYAFKTRYHNERIHQILYDVESDTILCAHTRKNSLLRLDAESGEVQDEIYIMRDESGFPIHNDHNHINTVTKVGETVLISLHNAGNDGSALGYVRDGQLKLFAFKDRGVHDAMLVGKDLLFTNSFNGPRIQAKEVDKGGVIWGGHEPLLCEINKVDGCYALRGLAYKNGKLIVGASCYAKREDRFRKDLTSGVFIFDGEKLELFAKGPFSQVYDIYPMDGVRSDNVPQTLSVEELDDMFLRSVGPVLLERDMAGDFAY